MTSGERIYQTTSRKGLDGAILPMRLWQRAKRIGIWNPVEIDFSQDRRDWRKLDALERTVLLHLSSLFQAGEESVTLDLLPLIATVAAEGRLEEEIYLTSFLWEEAKHVELFRRFLDEVAEDSSDLARFHSPAYRGIFYDELPTALAALWTDRSPPAQARASVVYNMIVEGVLAETGYHAYYRMLEDNDLMPGMQQAVRYLQADEARHLAYGVYLLSRLVAEHGEPVWTAIDEHMNRLAPLALDIIREVFDAYDTMPFGLDFGTFSGFALTQFQKRYARIEKARAASLADIDAQSLEELSEPDGDVRRSSSGDSVPGSSPGLETSETTPPGPRSAA